MGSVQRNVLMNKRNNINKTSNIINNDYIAKPMVFEENPNQRFLLGHLKKKKKK